MTDNSTVWCKECGYHCPLHGAPAYLDPVRDELATLREGNRVACNRFEVAERRVIELTAELNLTKDTLRHRTEALQRIIDRPCPNCANSQDAPQ